MLDGLEQPTAVGRACGASGRLHGTGTVDAMTATSPDLRDDLAGPDELAAAAAIAAAAAAPSGRGAARRRAAADAAVGALLHAAQRSLESIVIDANRGRRRTGIDVDDLRQEAALAAVSAARTWDPERHPSWTAYAAASAKNRLSAVLDSDEAGRALTRATARMLRHARGVRLSAEARGEHLDVSTLVDGVLAVGAARAGDRGADAEMAMRRSGELAALRKDLPYLLAEGAPVRLDAPLGEGGASIGDTIGVAHLDAGPLADAVSAMSTLLDPADVAALLKDKGRKGPAQRRALATFAAPHLQWAMLGPAIHVAA